MRTRLLLFLTIAGLLASGCATSVSGSALRDPADASAGSDSTLPTAPTSAAEQSPGTGQGDGASSAPSAPTTPASAPVPSTPEAATASSAATGATTPESAENPAAPDSAFNGAKPVDPGAFPGLVTEVGFTTPSGNISCGFQPGAVDCQIAQFDYSPPVQDCGSSGWGSNVELGASGPAQLYCAGDVNGGGPTLGYGSRITVDAITCVSQKSGVTCKNTATDYGFRLSRAEYVFFGPTAAPSTVGTISLPQAVIGSWTGHARTADILRNGMGSIQFRSYVMCEDDPVPGCDSVQNNEIVSGGYITFALTAADGDTGARGVVVQSTDDMAKPGATMTVRVTGHNLEFSFWPDTLFCSPDTPEGAWNCGA